MGAVTCQIRWRMESGTGALCRYNQLGGDTEIGELDFSEADRRMLAALMLCHERTPTGVRTCREGRAKKSSPAGRLTT